MIRPQEAQKEYKSCVFLCFLCILWQRPEQIRFFAYCLLPPAACLPYKIVFAFKPRAGIYYPNSPMEDQSRRKRYGYLGNMVLEVVLMKKVAGVLAIAFMVAVLVPQAVFAADAKGDDMVSK